MFIYTGEESQGRAQRERAMEQQSAFNKPIPPLSVKTIKRKQIRTVAEM